MTDKIPLFGPVLIKLQIASMHLKIKNYKMNERSTNEIINKFLLAGDRK